MTKRSSRATTVDAMIPLVVPRDGITRGELARILKISYAQATRSLERLRQHRLVSRRIRKSHYVYRLTGAHDSLTNGVLSTIYMN